MELWTAFILGLAGSVHCAGMCGPLVLALARVRPQTQRACVGRVAYHVGRLGSYCLLGLALGSVGHVIVPATFQRWLSVLLGILLLGGLVLSVKGAVAAQIFQWVGWLKKSMQVLLHKDSLVSQALMGALNGLLPCGLVYVAAAGAISTGHPLTGLGYMALFGVGTWPMMLAIHFAGQHLPIPARLPLSRVMRSAAFLMALLLILRGLELGIPFVSPNLSAAIDTGGSCH